MNNEPVAWMSIHEGVYSPSFEYLFSRTKKEGFIPLYTQEQLEEARKLGMQQERALWELSAIGQEIDK